MYIVQFKSKKLLQPYIIFESEELAQAENMYHQTKPEDFYHPDIESGNVKVVLSENETDIKQK